MCVKKQKLHVCLGQPLLAAPSAHDDQAEVLGVISKLKVIVTRDDQKRMLLIKTEQNVNVVH